MPTRVTVNNTLHADVYQASAVIDGRHEMDRSTSQSEFQFWSDFTQLFIAQERPQQMTVSSTRYCPAPSDPSSIHRITTMKTQKTPENLLRKYTSEAVLLHYTLLEH